MGVVKNLQGDGHQASLVKTTAIGAEGGEKNRNSINYERQQAQVDVPGERVDMISLFMMFNLPSLSLSVRLGRPDQTAPPRRLLTSCPASLSVNTRVSRTQTLNTQ